MCDFEDGAVKLSATRRQVERRCRLQPGPLSALFSAPTPSPLLAPYFWTHWSDHTHYYWVVLGTELCNVKFIGVHFRYLRAHLVKRTPPTQPVQVMLSRKRSQMWSDLWHTAQVWLSESLNTISLKQPHGASLCEQLCSARLDPHSAVTHDRFLSWVNLSKNTRVKMICFLVILTSYQ